MTKEEAVKYLQQLYPNGGHCWLDEQRIEAIGMAIKALQEEPMSKFKAGDHIRPIDSCLGAQRTILEVCDGWYVTNQGTLDFGYEDNWEAVEEPVKCMYTNEHYTDEDRKVLCEDCEERCEYSKKEESVSEQNLSNIQRIGKNWKEPVSDDLEKAAWLYYDKNRLPIPPEWDLHKEFIDFFKAGANWQKTKDSTCVSKDLEKAAKEWLIPKLDKSYANYGERKMMELTKFDGYAMLEAIEFGANWMLNKITKQDKNKGG